MDRLCRILSTVSEGLESKTNWEDVLQDKNGTKQMESMIGQAFDDLQKTMRELQNVAPVFPLAVDSQLMLFSGNGVRIGQLQGRTIEGTSGRPEEYRGTFSYCRQDVSADR
jgi:hypothetical protein